MLTAVAGGYGLPGSIPMGRQFYTEAISFSIPPCKYLLKIPWNFFAFSSMNLVVWSIKALKNVYHQWDQMNRLFRAFLFIYVAFLVST